MNVSVGQIWDTHAGNLWEVVELLPNDHIRVKHAGHGDGRPVTRADGPDTTHIWHQSGVTHGTLVSEVCRECGKRSPDCDDVIVDHDDDGKPLTVRWCTACYNHIINAPCPTVGERGVW